MQASWGIKELLRFTFHAFLKPRKAFKDIDPLAIRYPGVLIFLFLTGMLWINLHGYLLFVYPVWDNVARFILYSISFGTIAIINWLMTSLLFWRARLWFGGDKELSLAQVEKMVFSLTFVWLVLPLFDIFHLWLPQIPVSLPVFGFHTLHFAHIFAGIVIPIQLFFILKRIFPKKEIYWVVGLSLIALPIAKFVFEDFVFLLEQLVFKLGWISGKYDDSVAVTIGQYISVPIYTVLRLSVLKFPRHAIVINTIVPTGIFIAFTLPFIVGQHPLYPGYVSDSGLLDSSKSRTGETKDFIIRNAVNFPFDPALDPLKSFACIVRFLPETVNTSSDDGYPQARCDIVPGDSNRLVGDVWQDITGGETLKTKWDDPELLRLLTEEGNDIQVTVTTAPGDIVNFSGVFIEFDR